MKFKLFAAGLLSLALVTPAAAQGTPDDLHCFLLSNVFAKAEKDPKRRMLAGQATMFYLGKIDGKVNTQALAMTMRAPLDPKTAAYVLQLTRMIVAERGLTTLMVTHSMRQALTLGDRTVMLHEGRIIFDVSGAERAGLEVTDLLRRFEELRGEELADDALLLG